MFQRVTDLRTEEADISGVRESVLPFFIRLTYVP